MKITRRSALGILASTVALEQQQAVAQTAADGAVEVGWLGGAAPGMEVGVSWGVPWARGTVKREQTFLLTANDGKALPLQAWPLGYWPDGSIKFTGFATVTGATGPMRLTPVTAIAQTAGAVLTVAQSTQAIEIDTGKLQCRIPRSGSAFIGTLTIDGRVVARAGRLVCTLEDRTTAGVLRFPEFISEIKKVDVEQAGPVRAVVRIEGVHKGGAREWLPFVVRLYFYAGTAPVRLVHTIVFDGDQQKDFIKGLGLAFAVPMREQVHNRHIRLSGEDEGLWSEPVQPLSGRRGLAGNPYPDQLAGKRIANKETFNAAGQKLMTDWAVWDDFKLAQTTADGFTIQKRTNPESCWLDAIAGRRSSGLVFAGDVSGGLAVGVKNFWQSYPASLEVRKASSRVAELRVWLWSPEAPAMDLRHYDTKAHDLDSSYEDVQPGFSTPHGVARTSEMTLFPTGAVPAKAETMLQAKLAKAPPLLTAPPQHLHSTKVFGIWSLPDRSTEAKKALEDQLDAAFDFYRKEVEQRHWYGFWNFGDVMHQHDGARHEWRYDIGGFAWDNSELGTDMWLWYTFLRSGRADAFRMAEAMTRHTGEVDTYHMGRFAMLGSRHNVRHWGCGAKEARISQAAYRRFHYYLTTDERTGDTRWRDKIVVGMDSIAAMPFGFLTGPNQLYGYDPKTGKLYALEEQVGTYNLATIMGGGEVVFELNSLIDHPGWKKAWDQYCRLHNARRDVVERDKATGTEGADAQYARAGRLSGYLYMQNKDAAFAKKAWSGVRVPRIAPAQVKGPDVVTPIDDVMALSTNSIAQGCMEAIEVLEMCGDQMG